jgi:hypothetical protein
MLMLEATQPGGTNVVASEYKRFRRNPQPSPRCSLVIGRGDHSALAFHREKVMERDEEGADVPQGYMALIVVSTVFFHFIGDLPVVNAHAAMAPAQVGHTIEPIWPKTGRMLRWPFDSYLSKNALAELGRWAGGDFKFVT